MNKKKIYLADIVERIGEYDDDGDGEYLEFGDKLILSCYDVDDGVSYRITVRVDAENTLQRKEHKK